MFQFTKSHHSTSVTEKQRTTPQMNSAIMTLTVTLGKPPWDCLRLSGLM